MTYLQTHSPLLTSPVALWAGEYGRFASGVRRAELTAGPPIPRRGTTAAHRRGQSYERRALSHLRREIPEGLLLGPWISFDDFHGSSRLCQPDAVWLAGEAGEAGPRPVAVIFEVKYWHSRAAWHQLRCLYQPVLRRLVPPVTAIEVVEVTRWFDPAVPLPEEMVLLRTPSEALSLNGRFGIIAWI